MENRATDNTKDTTFGNLQPDNYKYVGTRTVLLHEIFLTTDEGRYIVTLHYPSRTLFKVKDLKEYFPDGQYPFKS